VEIDFYKKWACQKFIESSEGNIWDGHWACVVLALTNLVEEQLVPASVEKLIERNLAKTAEKHANRRQYQITEACADAAGEIRARQPSSIDAEKNKYFDLCQ